jgi:UDP-N-acetyl-D-glucosamine/UDP-N-acetyl-D-galactosamine dehydrogenase
MAAGIRTRKAMSNMSTKNTAYTMKNKICVIGMGYVGLPLALCLAKKFEVTGFDINHERINELTKGVDRNSETLGEDLKGSSMKFTSNPSDIRKCDFLIVAVPTPIDKAKKPDFRALTSASEIVGKNLQKGAIVVFESTVYPGATEDICAPIIEKESGLECGKDWKIGYSPERINPGDKEHTIDKIIKVVAGMDQESLNKIAHVYSQITQVYKTSSIKVAEAAKVIENTQRDLNIALINELSLIFKKMGLDTLEVLEAAGTKWNFLKFKPGLVGGHCIGVDPYYLTYKAEELGYHPQVILAGRRINDDMALEVVRLVVEGLNKHNKAVKNARILILGATFKENVRDARNSKVEDVIKELERLGAEVLLNDPLFKEVRFEHAIKKVVPLDSIKKVDAVILAVAHNEYKQISLQKIKSWMQNPVIVDVKGMLGKDKDVYRL